MFLLITTLFGFHGVISNDTTWSDTVYLTGDVLVENGATLTISPGTVVLYADSCEWDTVDTWYNDIDIHIKGNLRAIGLEQDSILFRHEDQYGWDVGWILMESGWDSLAFCSILAYGSFNCDNVILSITNSRIDGRGGVRGEESNFTITSCFFCETLWQGVQLSGGDLNVDNCTFENISEISEFTSHKLGAVLVGMGLESCTINNTTIFNARGRYGIIASEDGTDVAACGLFKCENVEIVNCIFDSIEGGGGAPSTSYTWPGGGGDGYGIYLEDCHDVTIDANKITRVFGGQGGENYETGERAPDGAPRPLVLYNSSPRITNNEFNSKGRYIYIDSTSQPVIGGAPDKGNRFLNAAARDYVIYNGSPYDIDATWNFWQTGPSMIDSLIFDYYDDPTKGIIHYDHSTDVEEKKSPTQPFALRSNLVKDVLHVSLSRGSTGGLVQLALFDASGRRVHSQSISGSQAAIDVSGLPRGVYFVIAQIGERQVTKKVVIR